MRWWVVTNACRASMFRVHGYHKYLVLALASIMAMGMALSYLYSMNHFNLLLSATRALD